MVDSRDDECVQGFTTWDCFGAMRTALLVTVWLAALLGRTFAAETQSQSIPVSDPLLLGSVLDETWDTSHAASEGYIDCMMSLSDVDLTVSMSQAGFVALTFDPRV